jgi:2,3-bisphosphoglycerate-dependent phosphoglycerate mutase
MPTLVLLRHGESTYNAENRFIGWFDADLTARGEQEARAAGALMAERGVAPDVVYTSMQTRAIRSPTWPNSTAWRGAVASVAGWPIMDRFGAWITMSEVRACRTF